MNALYNDANNSQNATAAAPLSPTSPRIHLHVEKLVLEGLTLGPGDADRLTGAFETELSRLLTREGTGAALGAADGTRSELSLVAPALSGSPAEMGTTLARAIYAGLSAADEEGGTR